MKNKKILITIIIIVILATISILTGLIINIVMNNNNNESKIKIHKLNSDVSYYELDGNDYSDISYINNSFYVVNTISHSDYSITCILNEASIENNSIKTYELKKKHFDKDFMECSFFDNYIRVEEDTGGNCEGDLIECDYFYDLNFKAVKEETLREKYGYRDYNDEYDNMKWKEYINEIDKIIDGECQKSKNISCDINKYNNEKQYDLYEPLLEQNNSVYIKRKYSNRLYVVKKEKN